MLLVDCISRIGKCNMQSVAIAHLSVEELASRKRLVAFDEFEDVKGHVVVSPPGHIRQILVDDDGCDVLLLAEDLGGVDGEGCAGTEVRDEFDGVERIIHNFVFRHSYGM